MVIDNNQMVKLNMVLDELLMGTKLDSQLIKHSHRKFLG